MHKIFPIKIKGFSIFAGVVFWPGILFMFFWAQGMIGALLIAPLIKTHAANVIEGFVEMLIFLLIPLFLLYVSYGQCIKASWKKRWWIIYVTWLMLVIVMGFLTSAALGGVSQAVVEGVAGSVFFRYMQYIGIAFIIALFSNIVVIPWVFLAIFFLKKIGENKVFLKNHNHSSQNEMNTKRMLS